MQGSFASKLKSLRQLLDDWELNAGESFEENLISEDVRNLLEPSGNYGSRVDKHIAFMHLKTVKQKPRRRNIDRGNDGNAVESIDARIGDRIYSTRILKRNTH